DSLAVLADHGIVLVGEQSLDLRPDFVEGSVEAEGVEPRLQVLLALALRLDRCAGAGSGGEHGGDQRSRAVHRCSPGAGDSCTAANTGQEANAGTAGSDGYSRSRRNGYLRALRASSFRSEERRVGKEGKCRC